MAAATTFPRKRWRWWPQVAAVALLGLAAAGYAVFVPVTRVNDARLGRLVVNSAGGGLGVRPSTRGAMSQGQIPFPVARQAARRQPRQAGAYSEQWTGKGPAITGAGVFLALLPSPADAARVRAQAVSQYLDASTLKRQGYTVLQRFSVPGVAGAAGDTFAASASAKSATAAVVVTDRRTVTVIFMEGRPAAARAGAVNLARRESALIGQRLPAFSLVGTTVPLVASVVYWVVAGAIVTGVAAGPGLVRRRRRRREAARQEAMRRGRLVRGKKVARRQAGMAKSLPSGLRRR
jgi:hypothetical protein